MYVYIVQLLFSAHVRSDRGRDPSGADTAASGKVGLNNYSPYLFLKKADSFSWLILWEKNRSIFYVLGAIIARYYFFIDHRRKASGRVGPIRLSFFF